MDTTEIYIKMCEEAEEIQAQAPEMSEDCEKEFWFPESYALIHVWLPRQDQLQEMVKEDAISQIQKLWGWIITDNYIPIGLPQPSMEQLWLAFVMQGKYNKTWDGEEWVKNKEK